MHKLSVEAPPKILVERYLIEIAKNYNVPYEPDAMAGVRAPRPPVPVPAPTPGHDVTLLVSMLLSLN